MGRDRASELVPIALAEGRPEAPRLRAPRSSPRLARKRPRPGPAGISYPEGPESRPRPP